MSKKCDCENIREKFLSGMFEQECEVSKLLQELELCEECKKFASGLISFWKSLNELTTLFDESLPKIDITGEVLERLKDLRNKETNVREIIGKEIDSPEEADWYSFIEGKLDDVTKYRCLSKLSLSQCVQREVERLKQVHQQLEELGDNIFYPELDEDLLPKVMARVFTYKGNTLPPESTEKEAIALLEKELMEISEETEYPISTSGEKVRKPDNVVTSGKIKVFRKPLEKSGRKQVTDHSNVYWFPRKVLPKILTFAAGILLTLFGIYWFLLRDFSVTTAPKALTSNKPIPTVRETERYKIIPPPSFLNDSEGFTSDNDREDDTKLPKKYIAKPLSEWEDILKENALVNAGKLMRMGTWASLTPEEARELLKKSGLSPLAVLGAVQFLPPEEAKVVLEAAIANNPEDAYLRFAMVNTLKNMDNIDYEELSAHLTAWTNSDPSNVLPYYMEANIYLRNGEVDSALACVKEANNLQGYNSYASLTAQAYKEALIAKGIDPQLADLLASASLGVRETQTLDEIAHNLLYYGKYYEEIGDYDTALMIYDALRNLGVNVDMSSDLLQERLAGVKYAQEAIYALIRLMTQTYSFSDIQSYIAFLQDLNQLLTNYNNALISFYELFDKLDPQQIIQLLNIYLTTGNVNIMLPSGQSATAK